MSVRSGLPITIYNVPATVTAQATGQFAEQQIIIPKGVYKIEGSFNFIATGGNFTGILVSLATVTGTPAAAQNVIFRNSITANGVAALPAGAAQTTQNLSLSNVVSFSADTILYFNIGAAVSAGTWGAANVGAQNRITFIQIGF